MSTQAMAGAPRTDARHRSVTPALRHSLWLAGGLLVAFLIPFVLADTLELNRDLYYGLYAVGVIGFVTVWARDTGQSLRRLAARRPVLTIGLAMTVSAILVVMVSRTEEATSRPGGINFLAALVWRGLLYGAVDGLLLSVFPILAVFAAFAGTKLRRRIGGTAAVAFIALVASLAMTAVYHAGYGEFRGEKLHKPVAGDVVWSAPTLLTLNPVGAPIAHIALHSAAVVHSYETDTFLPPHTTR
jgi:hypothetical protein